MPRGRPKAILKPCFPRVAGRPLLQRGPAGKGEQSQEPSGSSGSQLHRTRDRAAEASPPAPWGRRSEHGRQAQGHRSWGRKLPLGAPSPPGTEVPQAQRRHTPTLAIHTVGHRHPRPKHKGVHTATRSHPPWGQRAHSHLANSWGRRGQIHKHPSPTTSQTHGETATDFSQGVPTPRV